MNSKLQEKPRKTAPLQNVNHPPIAKMTYTEKAASLVPNSAARWRAIQNIQANNNQRSNGKMNTPKYTLFIYIQEKQHPNTNLRNTGQKY
jgi:hypothetical protein